MSQLIMRNLILVLVCSLGFLLFQPAPLGQANSHTATTNNTISCGGEGRYLLGVIPSWDRGLDCENTSYEELIEGNQTQILISNLTAIAVSIAGLVAVAFVIVGSFHFVLAGGSTEKATYARKTIINALIGLTIAIFGRIIIDVIYNQLTSV